MTSLTQDIKNKLSSLNIFEKIIGLNFAVLIIAQLVPSFMGYFKLPSNFWSYLKQPWSIISYAFLHFEFVPHFLFNMIVLYFVSRLVVNLFSVKLALNIYFLGAIFGGVAFVLFYNIISLKSVATLVGASAAIRALLIFVCAYTPKLDVTVFGFKIKLWYLGAFIIGLDVLNILANQNVGGNVAHLGGALLGYVYALQLKKGNDIGKGFERIMDTVISWFKTSKATKFKTVHKSKKSYVGKTKNEFNTFNKQKRIDLILDKISKSGYESLTKDEKEFLFRANK